MSVPKFSVWISTRNAAPWIERCLTSLSSQGYRDWEAVFIDDSSIDGTYDIAQRVVGSDPRFRLIRNRTRRRQVGCYLQALPYLRGEIVVELDGDDWFLEDALQAIADIYAADVLVEATCGQNNISGGIPEISRDNFWDRLVHSHAPRTWARALACDALARFPTAYLDDAGFPWLSAGDVALWAPICYLAQTIRGTRTPIYYVNRDNEESDWRKEGGLQRACVEAIHARWEGLLSE